MTDKVLDDVLGSLSSEVVLEGGEKIVEPKSEGLATLEERFVHLLDTKGNLAQMGKVQRIIGERYMEIQLFDWGRGKAGATQIFNLTQSIKNGLLVFDTEEQSHEAAKRSLGLNLGWKVRV